MPGITPPPSYLLKLFNAFIGITVFYILSVNTMWIENTKLYQLIVPNSFGIYLFHSMIIYWLEFIAIPYEIPPILLSLGVFAISLTLSYLLNNSSQKHWLGNYHRGKI